MQLQDVDGLTLMAVGWILGMGLGLIGGLIHVVVEIIIWWRIRRRRIAGD